MRNAVKSWVVVYGALATSLGSLGWIGMSFPAVAETSRPSPLGHVLVAPKDRWVVAYAYSSSSTFREVLDQLRLRSRVVVRLESVPRHALAPRSAFGLTSWIELPGVSRLGSRPLFTGVISCRARMAGARDLAARFAHELAHAEELARYGSITRAPGVRASHDDAHAAETANALEIGARVREELAASPVAVDLEFTRQLLGPEEWFYGWTLGELVALAQRGRPVAAVEATGLGPEVTRSAATSRSP